MADFKVYLELTEGFTLDVDRLDVGELGYLSQLVEAPIYSVNVKRGKNRELDKFSPGTCEITFDNRDRMFDPTFTGSPLYGSIYPGRRISVKYLSNVFGNIFEIPIFTGFTTEWGYSYGLGGEATATVSCIDGLSQLAGTTVESLVAPAELTGERINRVLTSADVNYPAGDLFIQKGNTVVAATTVTGSAFDHLDAATLTEQGLLFINGYGQLNFYQRNTSEALFLWSASNYDSYSLRYKDIQIEYSNDTLVNFVEAVAPAGTAVSRNTNSITTYQAQSQDYQTLHNNVDELQNFVDYITTEFGEPEFRIAQLTFNVNKYEQDTVKPVNATNLSLSEIGNLVSVGFQPPGGGDPIVYDSAQIIGVSHTATPSSYDITVTLMKAIGVNSFRLDSNSYGVLDVNILAF